MILTTHILSGAALGASVKNPYAVAGLAIALHFLLDMVPHGDYLNKKSKLREFWKVAIDLAIGFSLVAAMVFFQTQASISFFDIRNIAIGIFFSLLPDGTTFLNIWMKMEFLHPVRAFHERLHCHENGSPKREFHFKNNIGDILVSLISIVTLIFLL